MKFLNDVTKAPLLLAGAASIAIIGCALFTKVVTVFDAASAGIEACLNDYVDAQPAPGTSPNPLTIIAASAACAASALQVETVITAELSTPDGGVFVDDSGIPLVGTVRGRYVFPTARKAKLLAILADAKKVKLAP